MKLATTTSDFVACTSDQLKIIEILKKVGFDYVDYCFGVDYRNRNGIFLPDGKDYAKRLNEHCEKVGVKLIQSHSHIGRPLADNNEEFINDTKRCIEACAELDIPNVVIHSGYLPGISKKECFEKNKEFYEKLLPLAEKHGITILTENFNKMSVDGMYWIDNASDLLELIESVNHPLFHAVWDCGHANMQEMTQEQEMAILGSHIKAVHIHDNDGKNDQHICPFFGTLDMDSFVRGLKKIGYDGYFTFEADSFFNSSLIIDSSFKTNVEMKVEAEKFLYAIGKRIIDCYSL